LKVGRGFARWLCAAAIIAVEAAACELVVPDDLEARSPEASIPDGPGVDGRGADARGDSWCAFNAPPNAYCMDFDTVEAGGILVGNSAVLQISADANAPSAPNALESIVLEDADITAAVELDAGPVGTGNEQYLHMVFAVNPWVVPTGLRVLGLDYAGDSGLLVLKVLRGSPSLLWDAPTNGPTDFDIDAALPSGWQVLELIVDQASRRACLLSDGGLLSRKSANLRDSLRGAPTLFYGVAKASGAAEYRFDNVVAYTTNVAPPGCE
jgi:hypothetical protein